MRRIQITTTTTADLHDLVEHVSQVSGCRAELNSTGERGGMGAQEMITVLMTGGTGVALARALNTWLVGRRGQFTVKRQRTDGTVAEFTASGPDARGALESFLDHTDDEAQ